MYLMGIDPEDKTCWFAKHITKRWNAEYGEEMSYWEGRVTFHLEDNDLPAMRKLMESEGVSLDDIAHVFSVMFLGEIEIIEEPNNE